MVLVCHVTLQDHVTKGWSNIGRSPSCGLKHCSNGDIMILGDTLFHKTT